MVVVASIAIVDISCSVGQRCSPLVVVATIPWATQEHQLALLDTLEVAASTGYRLPFAAVATLVGPFQNVAVSLAEVAGGNRSFLQAALGGAIPMVEVIAALLVVT